MDFTGSLYGQSAISVQLDFVCPLIGPSGSLSVRRRSMGSMNRALAGTILVLACVTYLARQRDCECQLGTLVDT